MRKRTLFVLAVAVALLVSFWPKTATQPISSPPIAQPGTGTASRTSTPESADRRPGFLPREARDMVAVIGRGGPFRHRQDGSVFGNRESRLPRKQHGYYREYTVDTPGVDHRGARRIITGGDPPQVWYYTDDHYDSFRAFDVSALERRQ